MQDGRLLAETDGARHGRYAFGGRRVGSTRCGTRLGRREDLVARTEGDELARLDQPDIVYRLERARAWATMTTMPPRAFTCSIAAVSAASPSLSRLEFGSSMTSRKGLP